MVKITSLQLHFFSPSVKRCPPCKISNPIYWGDSPYLLTLFEKPCEGHIQVQKPTQALLQIRSPSNFRVESNIISMDSIIADILINDMKKVSPGKKLVGDPSLIGHSCKNFHPGLQKAPFHQKIKNYY